jgi:hypothetical protein
VTLVRTKISHKSFQTPSCLSLKYVSKFNRSPNMSNLSHLRLTINETKLIISIEKIQRFRENPKTVLLNFVQGKSWKYERVMERSGITEFLIPIVSCHSWYFDKTWKGTVAISYWSTILTVYYFNIISHGKNPVTHGERHDKVIQKRLSLSTIALTSESPKYTLIACARVLELNSP